MASPANKALAAKICQVPTCPGVYLYRDCAGRVIYVGKAINLKKRVAQYFQRRLKDVKTKTLVKEIADLEILPTPTELDALFLESEMIKRYQPHYNILLRDDKSSLYVKINWPQAVPELTFCRLPKDDGAEYLGPFYSARPLRQALRYLRRAFPYLTKPAQAGNRRSLDWHIGLEPRVDTAEDIKRYRQDLQHLSQIIRGERLQISRDLKRLMQQAAAAQDFERAAVYRNQLRNLSTLQQKVSLHDVNSLVERVDPGLTRLTDYLGLKHLPHRIEAFDISHSSGTNVVASMVVFLNGLSARSEYRRFKIRIDQNNDYANMQEVFKRRFSLANQKRWGLPDLILVDGGKGQLAVALTVLKDYGLALPIIGLAERFEEIIIDQFQSKVQVQNPIYNDGQYVILALPANDEARQLLERIRNEAHRFALMYHDHLRRRRQNLSLLDDIKGIGPCTKQRLLRHFKTLAGVQAASLTELATVLGSARAKIVHQAVGSSDKANQNRYNKN